MDNEEEWAAKIKKFYNLVEISSLDENASEEFLFDILQDLFSEGIKESTALQFVLLIQQHEDELIASVDKAVQVCGSLLNVFEFINTHYILFKSQVLVTVTGIYINFNLVDEARSLYIDFISLLIDMSTKAFLSTLLRKTSSDCLYMFTVANPGLLKKDIQDLLSSAVKETNFSFYNHIFVVVNTLYNSYQAENALHQNSGDAVDRKSEVNKSVSFLIENINNISASGLIMLLRKLTPCLGQCKISKSVINNMLLYCLPSWDLLQVFVYVYFHRYYQFLFKNMDDLHLLPTVSHLCLLLDLKKMTENQTLLVQYWLCDSFRGIKSHRNFTEAIYEFHVLEPNIYTRIQHFPIKVSSYLQICYPDSGAMSVEKQRNILRVLVTHSKHIHWYDKIIDFFTTLFRLYKHGIPSIQKDIIDVVERLTVGSLKSVMYTLDFCDNIEVLNTNSTGESSNLLRSIVKNLISLDTSDVLFDLKSFFLVLEKVALIKDICPLNIIEYMKSITHQLSGGETSWQIGNLLLSVCRNIVINNSDHEDVISELSVLFGIISRCFPSSHIQDRALLYNFLLGKTAPKNFRDVFVSCSTFLPQPLAPIEAEGCEVVTRGPLHIRKLKTNILDLVWKGHVLNNALHFDEGNDHNPEDLLGTYEEKIASNGAHRYITHRFTLLLAAEAICNIHAIQLNFTTDGPFDQIDSVVCTHLKVTEDNDDGGRNVDITFIPLQPIPATFNIKALFIDEEHNSWITNLKPFKMYFKHLFRPLTSGDAENDYRLFQALWENIKRTEDVCPETASVSVKNIGGVSMEPVFQELEKFVVNRSITSLDVGVYVPPSNHILFSFRFGEVRTIVMIATDGVPLLDQIDDYLESFC